MYFFTHVIHEKRPQINFFGQNFSKENKLLLDIYQLLEKKIVKVGSLNIELNLLPPVVCWSGSNSKPKSDMHFLES